MNIIQQSFGRGMSSLLDSTKTASDGYRLGLNVRIRENSVEPSFRPVQYNTPTGKHQAVFALDNTLVAVVGGFTYRIRLESKSAVPLGQTVAFNDNVDYVYHAAVPDPTNKLSATGTAVDTVSSCTVLQDNINQPQLLFSNNSMRLAKTYSQWTYESPEYIPIGGFMASSGNILFIASPDRKRIYRSVSGRQTDFVVAINNSGQKLGDAEKSYLAVAAAPLTCLQPAQAGGLLAFTKYGTFGLSPNFNVPLFYFEPVFTPSTIFPVGAVNHLSVSFALGQTVFVSPAGIQSFDQVAQVQRSSNNTPFGAALIKYFIRPINITATAMLDDYTFFGLNTIYGPAVVVYDSLLQQFVSIDLIAGQVKEFAILEADGLARLFFITESALYELPLYSGQRSTASVYIGEFTTDQAQVKSRITDVHLAFNNVKSAGLVGAQIWADKKLHDKCSAQKLLSVNDKVDAELLAVLPQRAPLAGETHTQGISFDFGDSRLAYANGVYVTFGADARLVSASITSENTEEASADNGQVTVDEEVMYLAGSFIDSASTGATVVETEIGNRLVLCADGETRKLLNGDEVVSCPAGEAVQFAAKVDKLYTDVESQVTDYTTAFGLLRPNSKLILLGGMGANPAGFKAVVDNRRVTAYPVLGVGETQSNAQIVAYFGKYNAMKRMIVSTPFVEYYLFSHIPADLTDTGAARSWLAGEIANSPGKFHVVCLSQAVSGTYADWPYVTLGVHAVITGGSTYSRQLLSGIVHVRAGTANLTATPYPGLLKVISTANQLRCLYAEGKDEFTISL